MAATYFIRAKLLIIIPRFRNQRRDRADCLMNLNTKVNLETDN